MNHQIERVEYRINKLLELYKGVEKYRRHSPSIKDDQYIEEVFEKLCTHQGYLLNDIARNMDTDIINADQLIEKLSRELEGYKDESGITDNCFPCWQNRKIEDAKNIIWNIPLCDKCTQLLFDKNIPGSKVKEELKNQRNAR